MPFGAIRLNPARPKCAVSKHASRAARSPRAAFSCAGKSLCARQSLGEEEHDRLRMRLYATLRAALYHYFRLSRSRRMIPRKLAVFRLASEAERQMRLMSRFLSSSLHVVVLALMIFAIVANIFVITQILFSPLNVVKGNSMHPAINESDAIILTSVEADEVNRGDVVVFNNPLAHGESIMHRVVGFEEKDGSTYAVTKGDGNPSPDPFLVSTWKIHDKVGVVLPKAGFFLGFLLSLPGFIICVICPLALLFLFLVANYYLENSKTGKCFLAREIIPAN
jgi:signal peptidase